MGWMCKECNIAVISGPAPCPKCGQPGPTTKLRVEKECCGHCGSKMEIRPIKGPFSYKTHRDLFIKEPLWLPTCTGCEDNILTGYEVKELDKRLEEVVNEGK
jgi:hypothetical protein